MTCGRGWEVEAVTDGRLHGAELASFARHVATCADCRTARRELDALHDALRAVPTPERTELEAERLRAGLLRAANERLLAPASSRLLAPASSRLPAFAAAALLVAVAVFAATRTTGEARAGGVRPEPPPSSVPRDPPPATTASDRAPPTPEASATATAPPRHAPPAEMFAHGVASFRGGNFGLADEQLGAFQRAAPGDPRCEDAAHLRAIARWRMGDRETASRLARDYLRAYPDGLRREDALRILDGTAQ